ARRWRGPPAAGRSPGIALRSDGACQTASRISASRARTPARCERVGRGAARRRTPGAAATDGLLGRRGLPLVLPLEALHTTGRVHELLLPRVEGMTLGADLDPDVRLGRAGLDDLPAGAGDRRVHIVRMNAHLHELLLLKSPQDITDLAHRVHGGQELLVAAGLLELVEQELHGLDRIELGQGLAEQPDLLQLVLLQQQLLFSGARLLDVDGREDAL